MSLVLLKDRLIESIFHSHTIITSFHFVHSTSVICTQTIHMSRTMLFNHWYTLGEVDPSAGREKKCYITEYIWRRMVWRVYGCGNGLWYENTFHNGKLYYNRLSIRKGCKVVVDLLVRINSIIVQRTRQDTEFERKREEKSEIINIHCICGLESFVGKARATTTSPPYKNQFVINYGSVIENDIRISLIVRRIAARVCVWLYGEHTAHMLSVKWPKSWMFLC